jgi:hypothetical protein
VIGTNMTLSRACPSIRPSRFCTPITRTG